MKCNSGMKPCPNEATHERQSWDMRRWYPCCPECAERYRKAAFPVRKLGKQKEPR